MSETTRGLLFAAFLMLFSAGCTAAAMSMQNVPSKGTDCIVKTVHWPMPNENYRPTFLTPRST